jgi:hypothetical protein
MSLLNLNTPQEKNPGSKKSSKLWMGAGLLVAVLGIGSTFAANIQINDNNQSEFGQGLTQTVYCGSENPTKITVTPISAFVNSTTTPGSDAVAPTWTSFTGTLGSFEDVDDEASKYRSLVRYQNPSTGTFIDNQAGYWIKNRNSSDSDDLYKGTARLTAPTGYPIFAPQVRQRGTSGDYGYYRYTNWVDGFFSGGRDAIPASSTPTKFELGGVQISNIPNECQSKDFIISSYGSESTPLELSDVLNVEEIAVHYGPANPGFSFDRTTPGVITGATGKVTVDVNVDVDGGYIKVLFTSAAGRLNADAVTKVIVETQDAVIN